MSSIPSRSHLHAATSAAGTSAASSREVATYLSSAYEVAERSASRPSTNTGAREQETERVSATEPKVTASAAEAMAAAAAAEEAKTAATAAAESMKLERDALQLELDSAKAELFTAKKKIASLESRLTK